MFAGLRLTCVVFVKLQYCFVCRNDGGQHNLRSAAYEALMELIKNSPKVSLRNLLVLNNKRRRCSLMAVMVLIVLHDLSNRMHLFLGLLRDSAKNHNGHSGTTAKSPTNGGASLIASVTRAYRSVPTLMAIRTLIHM